jgi:hypothetical protein
MGLGNTAEVTTFIAHRDIHFDSRQDDAVMYTSTCLLIWFCVLTKICKKNNKKSNQPSDETVVEPPVFIAKSSCYDKPPDETNDQVKLLPCSVQRSSALFTQTFVKHLVFFFFLV